jgi:hypothetical protein
VHMISSSVRPLALTAVLTLCILPAIAQTPADQSRGLVTATFQPTDEDIINPERARYAIRFAKTGTWEDATGFNSLGLRVTVTP